MTRWSKWFAPYWAAFLIVVAIAALASPVFFSNGENLIAALVSGAIPGLILPGFLGPFLVHAIISPEKAVRSGRVIYGLGGGLVIYVALAQALNPGSLMLPLSIALSFAGISIIGLHWFAIKGVHERSEEAKERRSIGTFD